MADPNDGSKTLPGATIFVALFVAFAVFLLSQMGQETRFSSGGKLFSQPRFWPAVGVASMVLFGLAHLATSWRHNQGWAWSEAAKWLLAFEYLAWFMIYVACVPYIGYLVATILFTILLAIRLGYRRPREIALAALLGFVIVLVFKTGLSVKIPGGAVYEYLPGGLRNFMILNF